MTRTPNEIQPERKRDKVVRCDTVRELMERSITRAVLGHRALDGGDVCAIEYMSGTQCVTLKVAPGPRWDEQKFVDVAHSIGWVARETNTANVWELCERNYRATFSTSLGQQRAARALAAARELLYAE